MLAGYVVGRIFVRSWASAGQRSFGALDSVGVSGSQVLVVPRISRLNGLGNGDTGPDEYGKRNRQGC